VSVLTTSNRVDYNGDGVTKTFAFSFPIYNLSDLQVWTNDSAMTTNAPEGLALRKLNGVDPFDYVQSIVNFPGGVKGGSITFAVAPPTNMKVILLRVLSETQAQVFGNFDKQDAKQAVEQGFDRLVMEVQQLKEQLNQALLLPAETFAADPTLPPVVNPSSTEIVQVGYNSTGTGLKIRRVPAGVRNFTFTNLSLGQLTSFKVAGTYTFTVPAGITALYIEMGGASGGGGGGGGTTGGAGHAARGTRGGDGGYCEFLYTAFTPGEVLDIVIGVGGAGGAAADDIISHAGFTGSPSTQTSLKRRAPFAADTVLLSDGGGAEGGAGGYYREANGSGGIGEQHGAIGNKAKGTGNFDVFDINFGWVDHRGQWGGHGGDGLYVVTQREIDLGENDISQFNATIPPTAGERGKDGFVAIYY